MMTNTRLARHIADIGFFEPRRQLTYKSQWCCAELTASSNLCSTCGKKHETLTLSDRMFVCECGNKMCRDHNASVNLENYTARSAGIYAAGDNGSVLAA